VRYLSTAFLWGSVLLTLPVGYAMAVVLLLVTAPFDKKRTLLHRFITGWCHLYLRFWPGWQVRIEGRKNIPAGPCVLVANHQSMADILALMGLRTDFKFVSKASLFRVPLAGWMMRRMKYVALERGKHGSHADMLVTCGALLEAGEKVLIFPEGTYASGPERLPFKRGAFRLAQRAQVPLVPVVIEGTGALVFEDGPWFAPTGRVTVKVMEPLTPPPADADDEPWVHEVEQRYEAWLQQPVRRGK
jgi:1-acyl-sn-glycerol-3-phosphate acyltransferase